MEKSVSLMKGFWTKSFWSSKLGQAACASIAAMSAMVIITTQFSANEAHAAPVAHPSVQIGLSVELA